MGPSTRGAPVLCAGHTGHCLDHHLVNMPIEQSVVGESVHPVEKNLEEDEGVESDQTMRNSKIMIIQRGEITKVEIG